MNDEVYTKTELVKTFIFNCLTARLKNGSLDEARDLAKQPDFNWDLILAAADEELVSPLLHKILQGEQIVPCAISNFSFAASNCRRLWNCWCHSDMTDISDKPRILSGRAGKTCC